MNYQDKAISPRYKAPVLQMLQFVRLPKYNCQLVVTIITSAQY